MIDEADTTLEFRVDCQTCYAYMVVNALIQCMTQINITKRRLYSMIKFMINHSRRDFSITTLYCIPSILWVNYIASCGSANFGPRASSPSHGARHAGICSPPDEIELKVTWKSGYSLTQESVLYLYC